MEFTMKFNMKNILIGIVMAFAVSVASAGEVERFVSETLAEIRSRNAQEATPAPEVKEETLSIVLPENKLTSKTKSLKSRSYRYDEVGRLVSVVCEACPELNESYVYDKQGNILEKRIGSKTYTYQYDTANQLVSMKSSEGQREYIYDKAGRLVEEKLNDKTDVKYKYGYLDKVTEVTRQGKITKFVYDGAGMLASKITPDGKIENWMWDGLALIRRGKDIHVNEPHISGGVPIASITPSGTQFHESDFLGTTLWSIDTKGNIISFQSDTIFGDGTIKTNRCARFTGKPYDEDLQAFVFPFRNYDEKTARWRSSDPAGYPDGVNQHFYAAVPTFGLDPLGLRYVIDSSMSASNQAVANNVINKVMASTYGQDPNSTVNKLYNDQNNTINVKVRDGKYTDSSNQYDPSTKTIYISPDDARNNSGYVVDDGNGGVKSGKTSIESMFVHESQHALDHQNGVNLDETSNGPYGDIKNTDTNAINEANKYRDAVNEPRRLWYRWLED